MCLLVKFVDDAKLEGAINTGENWDLFQKESVEAKVGDAALGWHSLKAVHLRINNKNASSNLTAQALKRKQLNSLS